MGLLWTVALAQNVVSRRAHTIRTHHTTQLRIFETQHAALLRQPVCLCIVALTFVGTGFGDLTPQLRPREPQRRLVDAFQLPKPLMANIRFQVKLERPEV